MKVIKLLITLSLLHFCVSSFAQTNLNSPIFTWGAGLDGSLYQKTAIYSDTDYGLLFEAPKDASNNRLNISFNWRGAGVTTPFFIQGSTLNVGIGTNSPIAKLDVRGATNFQDGRLTQHGDIPNDNNAVFVNTAPTGYGLYSKGGINTHYTFHFENQAGSTIMYGGGNGDIGIGTTSPLAKLDVRGATNFQGGRLTQQGDIPNDNNATFVNTAPTGYGLHSKGGADTHYAFHFENLSGNSILYGAGNGYVGVGTTLPYFKLDIEGHGVRIRNSSTAANSYTTLRIQGPDYNEGLEIDVFGNNNITSSLNWSYGGGAGSAAIINVNAKPLVFGTSNQGRMIIDAEGNVGIGTSNPNQKLTVNGTIYSREVKVDLSVPGPDYVFEADYNLPTLTEIETYIKANKHLPEVPTAKEMETNGINLSEMNMLLLKKVEELTLYVIELKKKNEVQDQQNTSLQKQIEDLKIVVYEKK